jgi:hypothetical protein
MLLVGIALTSGLFALGVVLYPKIRAASPTTPIAAVIEEALLPLIYQGICASYRLSELGVDTIEARIKGADKKKIADGIYALLPEKIGNFDLGLVKNVITKERFEKLVQDAFDRFFTEHQSHFDDEFNKWKAQNLPVAKPVP